jgi:prolyl oligopeptidase
VLAAGLIALCTQTLAAQSQSASANSLPAPPVAPVRDVVEDYYGTKVADPYRYMENLKDAEVDAWFKAQNDYTRSVLAKIPGRAKLLASIRALDQSVPRVFADRLPGDAFLIWKRLPNEDTGKMYLRNGVNGSDRLLVDPEKIKQFGVPGLSPRSEEHSF